MLTGLFSRLTSTNGLQVLISVLALAVGHACSATELKLSYKVEVPKEYRKAHIDPPPNSYSEVARYKESHEAFWWNCVMVKAQNLQAGCPFVCSGTPAATAGCTDGALNAECQIERLLKRYPATMVQDYLRSFASDPHAIKLFSEGRFKGKPIADIE